MALHRFISARREDEEVSACRMFESGAREGRRVGSTANLPFNSLLQLSLRRKT